MEVKVLSFFLVLALFCEINARTTINSKSRKKINEHCEYGSDKNWDSKTQTCDLGVLIQNFHPRCSLLKKDHVRMSIGQSNYVKCGDKYRRFTCYACGGDYTGWIGDGYEEYFNYRM